MQTSMINVYIEISKFQMTSNANNYNANQDFKK